MVSVALHAHSGGRGVELGQARQMVAVHKAAHALFWSLPTRFCVGCATDLAMNSGVGEFRVDFSTVAERDARVSLCHARGIRRI